jgi:hypothetical protein
MSNVESTELHCILKYGELALITYVPERPHELVLVKGKNNNLVSVFSGNPKFNRFCSE